MSNSCSKFEHAFEGTPLTTVFYKGRPCWVARDVGRVLGYQHDAKRFVQQITTHWNEEFIEDEDYELLHGRKLAEFKGLLQLGTNLVPSRTRQLVLLYESGVDLCLLKTSKPKGRALRRWLKREVLPQVKRDGRYESNRSVVDGQIREYPTHDPRRDRELSLRESELEYRKRQLEAGALRMLRERFERQSVLPADVLNMLAVVEAEAATGRSLSVFKPAADPRLMWQSPTQIGERLGVHRNTVGCAISDLGFLRGSETYSKAITNKAEHSDRTVVSYLYSPKAVQIIADFMGKPLDNEDA